MGCVSSKIIRRTGSFRQELRNSLHRVAGLEELLTNPKNGGDQLLTHLHISNAVSRNLKLVSPDTTNTLEEASSQSYQSEQEDQEGEHEDEAQETKALDTELINANAEPTNIETINTWELLAGLDEENNSDSVPTEQYHISHTRSFHTVEDFDTMLAEDKPIEVKGTSRESRDTFDHISRRKAMAKELAALRVPAFEFAKSGSLRDWLLQGGQVFSPGPCVTPKFGEFSKPLIDEKNVYIDVDEFELNAFTFDPEMVAQIEESMEQLTLEEEMIIKEILESLGEKKEERYSNFSNDGGEM